MEKQKEKTKLGFLHKKEKTIRFPVELKAVIIRKINDVPIKIGEKKIKNTDTSFTFLNGDKQGTFLIPENLKVTYADKKTNYIFFDFDSGVLSFEKEPYPLSIKQLDVLLTKNAVAGIFNRIRGGLENTPLSGTIIKYLVVGGLGAAIGYIIAITINPSQGAKTAQIIMQLLGGI